MIKQINGSGTGASQRDGVIVSEIEQQVTRLLRSFYGSLEQEPIPERFLDLLERLDDAERKQVDETRELR